MSYSGLRSALVVLLLIVTSACQPLGPREIPSARPAGWVVDLAGLLSAEDIASLERLGDAVHARDGAALAIVTIDSTYGTQPRYLATQTANRWGLGDPERDNGLLILVAIKDRAAEIALGDGIDSPAEVAKADRIMKEEMVARFRGGDNAEAIVAGARACAAEFFGVRDLPVEAPLAPKRPIHPRPWRAPKAWVYWLLAGLAAVTFIYLASLVADHWPKTCGRCYRWMKKFDVVAGNALLSEGQRFEVQLGSANYEVFQCPLCQGVHTKSLKRIRGDFKKCVKCGFLTATRVETFLSAPDSSNPREKLRQETCAFCGHEEISTIVVPAYKPTQRPKSQSPWFGDDRRDERRNRDDDNRSGGGGGFGFGGSSGGGRSGGSFSGGGSSGRW